MSVFLRSLLFVQRCLLQTEKWSRYEINKVEIGSITYLVVMTEAVHRTYT